ncbi:MAG: hypothetical protein GXP34_11675 [Actinobacteria bacterium]|nr:hypothetical protein [Actinomycetota bacterium]
MSDPSRPWRLAWRRRHGWVRLTAWIVVLVVLPVAAYQFGRRADTPAEAIAHAAPPAPADITATVERRTLEAAEVFLGEVTLDVVPLATPRAGVVVDIPVEAGDTTTEGTVAAVLDDRPIVMLRGDLPLIDDLQPGATGSWVTQLQQSLTRLGLYTLEVDGRYGPATQWAVSRLYESIGFRPPTASEPLSGRATAGGTPLPSAEVLFVSSLPTRVIDVSAHRGDIVAAADVLMDFAGAAPAVVVRVDPTDAKRFHTGDSVLIRRGGGQDDLPGRVQSIEENTAEEAGGLTQIVTIAPDAPLPADQAGKTVKVLVGATSTGGPVLVVPVTAIRSAADGGTYVDVQTAPEEFDRVPVTAGLAVGGFVAVESPDGRLHEGGKVRVGTVAETGGS